MDGHGPQRFQLENQLKALKDKKVHNIRVYEELHKRTKEVVVQNLQSGVESPLDAENVRATSLKNAELFKMYLAQLKQIQQSSSLGHNIDFLSTNSISSLSASQLAFQKEPIFMTSLALQEMSSPNHHNNIFKSYVFNTVSQVKRIESLNDGDTRDRDSLAAARANWKSDLQIEQMQLLYDDFCVDESTGSVTATCPTDKTLLRSAMLEDHQNSVMINRLQEDYKNDEKVKDQVFQYPCQINSLTQLLLRTKATNSQNEQDIAPKIETLQKVSIPKLKEKIEKSWLVEFEAELNNQKKLYQLFTRVWSLYRLECHQEADRGMNQSQPVSLMSPKAEAALSNLISASTSNLAELQKEVPDNLEKVQAHIKSMQASQPLQKTDKRGGGSHRNATSGLPESELESQEVKSEIRIQLDILWEALKKQRQLVETLGDKIEEQMNETFMIQKEVSGENKASRLIR